jgi:hypothetical protein
LSKKWLAVTIAQILETFSIEWNILSQIWPLCFFLSYVCVCGKTGSSLNAKKKEEETMKKMFQTIDGWTWQDDDIFKLKNG